MGYFFIMLSVFFTIAILGKLLLLFKTGFRFTDSLNAYQSGKLTGAIVYWSFHILATIFFIYFGLKWIKKPIKPSVSFEK